MEANIVVRVPAVEKLWDYAASGIGAVAGPLLHRWRAKREADAVRIGAWAEADRLRIEAEGEADAHKIIAAAQAETHRFMTVQAEDYHMMPIGTNDVIRRMVFQEKKRLANVANVLEDAARELEGMLTADHGPCHDWTSCFFDLAQDVSSTRLKRTWSRLLAGQIKRPGSVSLRTLHVLKTMTVDDAIVFEKVSSLVMDHFIFYKPEWHRHYGGLYSSLVQLDECGLLRTERLNKTLDAVPVCLRSGDVLLKVRRRAHPLARLYSPLVIPIINLTSAGCELNRIIECKPDGFHMRSFALYCKRRYHRLLRTLPGADASANVDGEDGFVEVEPRLRGSTSHEE